MRLGIRTNVLIPVEAAELVKEQVLEAQASRIEQVLASHKIAARVWGGRVTPRYVQFHVTTAWGTRLSRVVNLSEEIAMALGARNCRIQRRNGALEIEVPLEEVRGVSFLSILKQVRHVPPYTALLGVDEANHPLFVRLPSPEVAHILVAGTTGCGKTALLRSMILSLALGNRRSALQMVLIDPKGRGFAPLNGLPHLLRPVLSETSEALEALQMLVQEMLRRDREGRSEPRIAVFVDELADLAQEGGASCAELLTRLAQRGREAGIHLVVGTQKPTSQVAGPLFKSNFPVRLVGRVASPEDARVAAGIGGTGAERLLGRGDFLAVASGEVIRFQSAYADAGELQFLLRSLGSGGRWERVRALCLQAGAEETGRADRSGPWARRLGRWTPSAPSEPSAVSRR